jgi:hypothetical protein
LPVVSVNTGVRLPSAFTWTTFSFPDRTYVFPVAVVATSSGDSPADAGTTVFTAPTGGVAATRAAGVDVITLGAVAAVANVGRFA